MAVPFSPDVATELIEKQPGRTSKERVSDALERGIIRSAGHNPLAGQGGALVKMYNDGRIPDVIRDENRRPFRYYPKDSSSQRLIESHAEPLEPSLPAISFRPTGEQDRILTALVLVGTFESRTEAIQWLLDQGIEKKRPEIQSALDTSEQIESLRKSVKITLSR